MDFDSNLFLEGCRPTQVIIVNYHDTDSSYSNLSKNRSHVRKAEKRNYRISHVCLKIKKVSPIFVCLVTEFVTSSIVHIRIDLTR